MLDFFPRTPSGCFGRWPPGVIINRWKAITLLPEGLAPSSFRQNVCFDRPNIFCIWTDDVRLHLISIISWLCIFNELFSNSDNSGSRPEADLGGGGWVRRPPLTELGGGEGIISPPPNEMKIFIFLVTFTSLIVHNLTTATLITVCAHSRAFHMCAIASAIAPQFKERDSGQLRWKFPPRACR